MTKQHSPKSKVKSPNISRFITESGKRFGAKKWKRPQFSFKIRPGLVKWNILLSIGLSAVFLIAIIGVSLRIEAEWVQRNVNLAKRQQLNQQISTWQRIVLNYPGYRDGYFELSLLEYQAGNTDKAKIYLEEALKIDPNFKQGRTFEEFLKTR